MQPHVIPALAGLAGGTTEPVGQFRYTVDTDSWWWSEEMYAIHGFMPGEIQPTTAVMLAHKHPEDRTFWAQDLADAMATGEPFCSRHRVIDAREKVHILVWIGNSKRDESGRVVEVRGFVVDLTKSQHNDLADQLREAVDRSAETRAIIEQAKGAMMITYSMTEDEAFALLRWHSQYANIKLFVLAEQLMDQLNKPDIHANPRQKLNRFLGPLAARETADIPARPTTSRRGERSDGSHSG